MAMSNSYCPQPRYCAEYQERAKTDKQATAMWDASAGLGYRETGYFFAVEWQRRCFLAPEPGVPDAVKDLLAPFAADGFPAMLAKSSIIEAYNRGKAGK